MQKDAKTRIYTVPVLNHALDILEYLSRISVPLRLNEISDATGVSLTTTYRILQTLVRRGYVARDAEGRFSILSPPTTIVISPETQGASGVDDQKIRNNGFK